MSRIGSIANKITKRVHPKRTARGIRIMKENHYISEQHEDATVTDVAKILYGFEATMHNRQILTALDNMHLVCKTFSEKSKKFNDKWDRWCADTFLTLMFSNYDLLKQIKKIEFSTRNGEMAVYYKDGIVEDFIKDGYTKEGTELRNIDHDGEVFDPHLVDDKRVVSELLLEMYYRKL